MATFRVFMHMTVIGCAAGTCGLFIIVFRSRLLMLVIILLFLVGLILLVSTTRLLIMVPLSLSRHTQMARSCKSLHYCNHSNLDRSNLLRGFFDRTWAIVYRIWNSFGKI